MHHSPRAESLTGELASRYRVLSLGGLAVISHGFDRMTNDADVWLEPFQTAKQWTSAVQGIIGNWPQLRIVAVGIWTDVDPCDLAMQIEQDGVVRITGADQPLAIFLRPNELAESQFDEVWERASPMEDGTRLPDPIDLLVTRMMTDRDKDLQDIAFLESKVEKDYLTRIFRHGLHSVLSQ